jgi:hypothetical protein
MKCNGIEIRSTADYDRLPVDREMRELIRAVHGAEHQMLRHSVPRNAGGAVQFASMLGPLSRDAVTVRTSPRIQTVATKQFDAGRDRLRLKVEIMRRMTG